MRSELARLGALLIVLLISGSAASKESINCPAPTVLDRRSGWCVLEADAQLTAAIKPPAGARIDCRGHALTPMTAGGPSPLPAAKLTSATFTPSIPNTAIFIDGARNVTVRHCELDGFDFGIVSIHAARPKKQSHCDSDDEGMSHLVANLINVRARGVLLLGSDDTEIAHNVITTALGSSTGVVLVQGASHNRVARNTVSGSARGPEFAPGFPGNLYRGNPFSADGIQCFYGAAFSSLVVDGALHQIGYFPGMQQLGNEIEGNLIALHAPPSAGASTRGIDVEAGCNETLIRNNEVLSADRGIFLGSAVSGGTNVPSHCALPDPKTGETRICVLDPDCKMAGYDEVDLGPCGDVNVPTTCETPAYAGTAPTTCVNDASCCFPDGHGGCATNLSPCWHATFDLTADPHPRGLRVENNKLGPDLTRHGIIDSGSDHPFIAGNTIVCDGVCPIIRPNGLASFGIILSEKSFGTATVTDNVVRGFGTSLLLESAGIAYGAKVSHNDFIGRGVALLQADLPLDFQLNLTPPGSTPQPAEVDDGSEGNYWGKSCPGFNAADSHDGSGQTDPARIDDHPFGAPVARTDGVGQTCQ